MAEPENPWQAIEGAHRLSGVLAEWEMTSGRHFTSVRGFLRPLQGLSATYPCPEPDADCCGRGVVVHAPDDIVAVCRAQPPRCEDLTLRKKQIVVYRLDARGMASRLGELLMLAQVTPEDLDGSRRTFRIGEYRPVAGHAFSAYLTVQSHGEAMSRVAESLTARERSPFLLLTPTERLITPATARLLGSRDDHVICLAEHVEFADGGRLRLLGPLERTVGPFKSKVVEAAQKELAGDMVFFETPPDASWPELVIRMPDGETASVKIRGIEGIFNYSQMGMADGRSSRPTEQWKLLYEFAREGGEISWRSPAARRENKSRKKNLAGDLRRFFGLGDDPILYIRKSKAYRTRFLISE